MFDGLSEEMSEEDQKYDMGLIDEIGFIFGGHKCGIVVSYTASCD